MIPQLPIGDYPVPGRTKAEAALTKAKKAKLQVLAVGSLTYDNEHILKHVNGQPKRISLWELHPVLAFYVCPAAKTCDTTSTNGHWIELSLWMKTQH